MKNKFIVVSLLLSAMVVSGCSTLSSSRLTGEKQPERSGKVFVTQDKLPAKVKKDTIGVVKAKARAGYGHTKSLYPRLAKEARKIGANGVVNVSGGHQVTLFSWAAPHTSGTAVKVNDTGKLENLDGKFY